MRSGGEVSGGQVGGSFCVGLVAGRCCLYCESRFLGIVSAALITVFMEKTLHGPSECPLCEDAASRGHSVPLDEAVSSLFCSSSSLFTYNTGSASVNFTTSYFSCY